MSARCRAKEDATVSEETPICLLTSRNMASMSVRRSAEADIRSWASRSTLFEASAHVTTSVAL